MSGTRGNRRLSHSFRVGGTLAALGFVLALTGPAIAGATSSSGAPVSADCRSNAATSAALAACTAAKPSEPAPAAKPDAPPEQPPGLAATFDDPSGRPPHLGRAASVARAIPAKKKPARRKVSSPAIIAQPDITAPEQPGLFEALFGNSPGAVSPDGTAPATDPTNTAATDPAGPSKSKGKIKGLKSARNTDSTLPAVTTVPDEGFFNTVDTPFATGDLGYPLLSPANIEPLKAAIKRYADIVARGGWPTVSPLQMQLGTNNPAVAELRQHLKLEGDLKADPSGFSGPENFDQDVAEALKHWQGRYGLSETGDLMDADRLKNGTRTVMALNVTAEARLAQLKANLTRLQNKSVPKGRYVLVNIPGEQIEAIDGNRVVLRLNGVVGRPERPSPLLSSNIEEVKFNPLWTMPPTVVKEDLIPKGQSLQAKGVDVLAKFGIDAFNGAGKKVDTSSINWSKTTVDSYRFSQQPGKDNPLGFAKLDFASPESVYMHDTPSAKLFDKSYRAASSGCIRVEHMDRLVSWLLRETDGWGQGHVQAMKETGESKIVRLKHAVPLNWVYVTAWATEDGLVHFRRDLYGKDEAFGVSKTASAY
jgi:L,D-transpeptidase YcbB